MLKGTPTAARIICFRNC